MALLFMDGFDHYATADFAKKGWTITSTPTIDASSGRRSSNSLRMTYSSGTARSAQKTVGASSTLIVGMAIKVSTLPASDFAICNFIDVATTQCSLRLNANGTLSVVRGASTAVTDGTSVSTITAGAFYFVEWKVTFADSIGAGSCKVRVNGVDWITVATGQDLKASANATADILTIGPLNQVLTIYYDDLYLCNTSGSLNNDFLGDCRIDTVYPTSDGTYTTFTPSTGTDHYALVDEATPNTSDYNSSTTNVGDRDSYGLGNLEALSSQTIYGVQVNAAALKDDAGARSLGTMVRSGSTNADGAGVALSTSQLYISQVYETDPNSSVAWTESSVNAMEAGTRVTA